MSRLRDGMRAWQAACQRRLPESEHERVLATSRLERHGGLNALYLAGSPYEMGYQQGMLARQLVHGFRQAAYAYVTTQLRMPRRLALPILFYHASSYWPTLPVEIAEEMHGIADGAGVHPIEVLVSNAIWEVLLVSGCSEFAAVGPATADGSLVHAYNYDLMQPEHALIQPYLAALFYRPSQGIPFITVNTVGSVGANAGVNEAGISVAWDNTYLSAEKGKELTKRIQLPAVPFIITLRRILQHAQCLDEAVRIVVETLPRPLADIIILGSAQEGRAVALETAGHVYAVREMEDGLVWSTNCFRSPELAPFDRRGDSRALPEDEAWECIPRYTAYRQLLSAERGCVTPSVAASMLRDPYPREARGFVHPNPAPRATISRELTSWSLVMEPGKRRLWISDTELPGCQGQFFAFDLGTWQRLPELDLAPTGYKAALQAARRFLDGDLAAALAGLHEAFALDGQSAPLSLMTGVVQGLSKDEQGANDTLRQVQAEWPDTAAASLVRSWLDSVPTAELPPLPFPSAICPLVHLRPGAAWQERAVPGAARDG